MQENDLERLPVPDPPTGRDVSGVKVHRTAVAKLDRATRVRMAARLFRMGWRLSDISRALGVGANTVSKDIKRLKGLYLKRAIQDIKLWMADALSTLDDVEAEAWSQWEKSKGRKRTRDVVKTDTRGTTIERHVITLEPDNSYLKVVLDCIKRREELLGLDKQTAQEVRATLILQGDLGSIDHYHHINAEELDAIREALIRQVGGEVSYEQTKVGEQAIAAN